VLIIPGSWVRVPPAPPTVEGDVAVELALDMHGAHTEEYSMSGRSRDLADRCALIAAQRPHATRVGGSRWMIWTSSIRCPRARQRSPHGSWSFGARSAVAVSKLHRFRARHPLAGLPNLWLARGVGSAIRVCTRCSSAAALMPVSRWCNRISAGSRSRTTGCFGWSRARRDVSGQLALPGRRLASDGSEDGASKPPPATGPPPLHACYSADHGS